MKKIISYIRIPHIGIPVVAISIVGLGVLGYYAVGGSSDIAMAEVVRGAVAQTVSVSGRVRAAQNATLSVQRSGRINKIEKHVGDVVKAGDIIIETDAEDLRAAVKQAKAVLSTEQAKLALLTGTRPEEIAIAEIAQSNTSAVTKAAREMLFDKIKAGYQGADTVIRNGVDQFIQNPTTPMAKINLPVLDQEEARKVARERYELEADLVTMEQSIPQTADEVTPDTVTLFQKKLDKVSTFLGNFARLVSSTSGGNGVTETDGYLSVAKSEGVAKLRSTITSSASSLVDANRAVVDAQSREHIADQQLMIKKVGASSADVRVQRTLVDNAQAALDVANAHLETTLVRAPFDGVVASITADIGETVQAGVPFITVTSQGAYQVEAFISEGTISKISVGNQAVVTIDALGTAMVVPATVISVDLSEQLVGGVITYKTKLQLNQTDSRIKNGMTAGVVITTAEAQDTLVIPDEAVTYKDGEWFVQVAENGVRTYRKIVQGIRGAGKAEVLSGLTEGEKVFIAN